MTTETTNQESAQALWDQLDREDGNTPVLRQETREEPQTEGASTAEDTTQAPAQAGAEGGADDTTAEDDPYAGLPPRVREELLGLKTIVQQQSQRLRNAEGHIGGLNKRLADAVAARTQVAGDSAPTSKQIGEAAGSATKMKQLMEDYPEFGSAMQEALKEQLDALRAERDSAPQKPSGITPEQLEARLELQRIEAKHPGWQKRVVEPGFRGWLQSQPEEIQILADSPKADHAIRVLDLHKEATSNPRQTERNQRLSAAAAIPTGRTTNSVRAKSTDDMTDKELWAYLDSLEKQKA